MNSYELSRNFCEWAFNNPERIKPIHYAIYFFSIEHCNRLGWKDKFGLPSQMVMEAIGVKNWRTYSAGLNDLVDFGFIKMIETSKNQYSANVVAIVKNTKAHTKALDKALQKHGTKHSQSTVSIDKQETINKEQVTIILDDEKVNRAIALESDFEDFYNAYGKFIDKKAAKAVWFKMSDMDRHHALNSVDHYVKANPEKKYRKSPMRWLKNECWKDEYAVMKTEDVKPPQKNYTFAELAGIEMPD